MNANIVDNENPTQNQNQTPSIINRVNDFFKMPIYYNESKVELKQNIITDLELNNAIDASSTSIYSYCFNNNNDVSKKLNEQITKYYTTDVHFLQENQKLIKEFVLPKSRYSHFTPNYKNIVDIWNELKIEHGFREKYYYVDWDTFEFLNTSEIFLQFISIYNLFSPIFSLIIPIIILILPFFILKLKGMPITMDEYFEVLKTVAQANAVGKLFTSNFSEIPNQEKIYIFVSAAFYLFSIYQNVMVCVKFNNNMKTIHTHFKEINIYIEDTLNTMQQYITHTLHLTTHKIFNDNLLVKMATLKNINAKITSISEYSLYNVNKMKEIGKILKYFYELHTNDAYEDAIIYSIGFNGYMDCLEGLQSNIRERKMNFATLSENNKKGILKDSYYACLKDASPVKNTIKLHKNRIITGPNASGKTTILKSTLINIIFTQQFGCGFYGSAKFTPFNHIHCYLNIPDTSGRDSLFQAEARRCKEILDQIEVCFKHETHFCAFDELYSGTNPEEAEISATAFMLYLQKYKNVSCFLTTHFIKICEKLEHVKSIQNCKMVTNMDKENGMKYTFKLAKGISKVKGGIRILTEMNYPKEILENANTFKNKYFKM